MAINWGANTFGTGAFSGTPIAAPSITTAASGSSILVIAVAFAAPLTFTVADNKGNNSASYQLVGTVSSNTSDGISMGAYLCTNAAGGAGHVVSLTVSSNVGGADFYVVEITGGDLTASLVNTSNGANTGFLGNPGTNPVTTTTANALIIGALQNNTNAVTTFTPGGSFTDINHNLTDGSIIVGRVVSATGTYDPNIAFAPTGGREQLFTVALKAAGAASTASVAWIV